MAVPFERLILKRARKESAAKLRQRLDGLMRQRAKLVQRIASKRTRFSKRPLQRMLRDGDSLTRKIRAILAQKESRGGGRAFVGKSAPFGGRPEIRRRRKARREQRRRRATDRMGSEEYRGTRRPKTSEAMLEQLRRSKGDAEHEADAAAINEDAAAAAEGEVMPVDAEGAIVDAEAGADVEAEGGIMEMLWPTEKPIYKRPALWVAGALVVGGVVFVKQRG